MSTPYFKHPPELSALFAVYLAAIIFIIIYYNRWTLNGLKSILVTGMTVMARGLVLPGLTARLVCLPSWQTEHTGCCSISSDRVSGRASMTQSPPSSKTVFHRGTLMAATFCTPTNQPVRKSLQVTATWFLSNCTLLWSHFISTAKNALQDIRIYVPVGYIVGWVFFINI